MSDRKPDSARDPLAQAVVAALRADPEAARDLAIVVETCLQDEREDSVPAYTVASLSACTGISEKTLRAEIRAGRLVARRRGRRYVIAPGAVADWVQAAPRAAHRTPTRRARRGTQGPLSRAVAGLDEGA